jgi:hypothetical protein
MTPRLPVEFNERYVPSVTTSVSRAVCDQPSAAKLGGKHQAISDPLSPKPTVADGSTVCVRKISHFAQRERKPNKHYRGRGYDLWARLEVLNGYFFVMHKANCPLFPPHQVLCR